MLLYLITVKVPLISVPVYKTSMTYLTNSFLVWFLFNSPLNPFLHTVLMGILYGSCAPARYDNFADLLTVLQTNTTLSLSFLFFLDAFNLSDQQVLDSVHGSDSVFGFSKVNRNMGGL